MTDTTTDRRVGGVVTQRIANPWHPFDFNDKTVWQSAGTRRERTVKVWQYLLAAAVAASTACTPVVADGYYRAHNDLGGIFADYVDLTRDLTEAGTPVRFSGQIMSGATFLVTVPGSCAEPDATFHFHGASDAQGNHDMIWSFRAGAQYPEPLRTWFRGDITAGEGPMWLYGPNEFAELTAFELRDMGVLEVCG